MNCLARVWETCSLQCRDPESPIQLFKYLFFFVLGTSIFIGASWVVGYLLNLLVPAPEPTHSVLIALGAGCIFLVSLLVSSTVWSVKTFGWLKTHLVALALAALTGVIVGIVFLDPYVSAWFSQHIHTLTYTAKNETLTCHQVPSTDPCQGYGVILIFGLLFSPFILWGIFKFIQYYYLDCRKKSEYAVL